MFINRRNYILAWDVVAGNKTITVHNIKPLNRPTDTFFNQLLLLLWFFLRGAWVLLAFRLLWLGLVVLCLKVQVKCLKEANSYRLWRLATLLFFGRALFLLESREINNNRGSSTYISLCVGHFRTLWCCGPCLDVPSSADCCSLPSAETAAKTELKHRWIPVSKKS